MNRSSSASPICGIVLLPFLLPLLSKATPIPNNPHYNLVAEELLKRLNVLIAIPILEILPQFRGEGGGCEIRPLEDKLLMYLIEALRTLLREVVHPFLYLDVYRHHSLLSLSLFRLATFLN